VYSTFDDALGMAFGFLVERFDLFLAYLGHSSSAAANVGSASTTAVAHHLHGAQVAGLALIGLGILIIFGATIRFIHHRKTIACDETVGYGTALGDSLLALLLICFAAFLGVYVYHQLMTLR
jgi:putative membrane protein